MKGRNTIELNLATVMEALQEWIDKRMEHHPQNVTNFSASVQGHCPVFKLEVEERADSAQAEPK